jgi:GH24 family phage-related lysozyme (muramidase)
MTDATTASAPALPPIAAADPLAHAASQAGINLIVTEEDSGQAYYTHHYSHFEWPEGASGPTVGIGYDCGYSTPEQIQKDWSGIISDPMVSVLMHAAGLKGEAAHMFVRTHGGSVTITWVQAMDEFDRRELPKWEAACRKALPNYDLLPPDCAGAIDSLAYNRGAGGFRMAGDRYREMRAITAHMEAKEFSKIPGEYLSMRRLWPVGGDLWRRREHEASLFRQGLATANDDHATPNAGNPTP